MGCHAFNEKDEIACRRQSGLESIVIQVAMQARKAGICVLPSIHIRDAPWTIKNVKMAEQSCVCYYSPVSWEWEIWSLLLCHLNVNEELIMTA